MAAEAKVKDIDSLIAGEIQAALSGETPRETVSPALLPDGAFYAAAGEAFLKHRGAAHRWSFKGYEAPQALHAEGLRLTPKASCAGLAAGYTPVLHSSVHGA